MDINAKNQAVLAYIGDAIYELEIRKYLLSKNINNVNELQKEAVLYVSARAQANILNVLIEKSVLTDEEITIIKRARNYKPASKPKHSDIKTYKKATALEALFGTLYLNNDKIRIKEIMKEIIGD